MKEAFAVLLTIGVIYWTFRQNQIKKKDAYMRGEDFYYDSTQKKVRSVHEPDLPPSAQTGLSLLSLIVFAVLISLVLWAVATILS